MSREPTYSDIAALTEDEARALFCAIRWPDGAFCPRCGCKKFYENKRDRMLDCAECDARYSCTTGTAFQNRKVSFRKLLQIIYLFAVHPKGIASIQVARMVGVQQKTAYLLMQKMREAMQAEIAALKLAGDVEVDGAVFGGYRYRLPSPNRAGGKMRYLPRGKKQTVVVLKQRGGPSVPVVVRQESEAIFAVRRFVDRDATLHVDGAHAWDSLQHLHQLARVNHNVSFVDGQACTNGAESFFSMLRRGHIGVYHRIGGDHLALYAAEASWRNAHRDKAVQFADLLGACCRQVSAKWRGYYQRTDETQAVSLPAAIASLSPAPDFAANKASWPVKGKNLIKLVSNSVAAAVPANLRDDVTQSVICAALAGEWHRTDLGNAIRHYRNILSRGVAGSFLPDYELDKAVTESGLTAIDLVRGAA